jgi:predicted metal-binding membrane protein
VAGTTAYPLPRERNLILGRLLMLAAAAWALLVWQALTVDAATAMMSTMGMGAPLFLAIWVAMMVAIMFPTAAPMILTFARVQAGKRRQERTFVPTWVFVAAYLLVWSALGIAAYAGAVDVADGRRRPQRRGHSSLRGHLPGDTTGPLVGVLLGFLSDHARSKALDDIGEGRQAREIRERYLSSESAG